MYRSLPLRVSLALFTCGSGFGQLAPPEALSEAFQLRSRTVVGDWDGDGRDDVAYWTEDGVFTRTSGPTGLAGPEILAWPTAERIADLRSFDVDGDGDADLTLAKENEGGWLENTGGTFGAFQVLVTDVEPSFGEPDAVGFRFLVTDANGDGMADVVALTAGLAGPGPITVRLGTATGVFAAPTTAVRFTRSTSRLFEVDVEGDGDVDLVHLQLGDPAFDTELELALNDGLGGFTGSPAQLVAVFPGATDHVDFGDVDGDGRMDVLYGLDVADGSKGYFFRRYLGASTFGPSVRVDALPWTRDVEPLDVDGDGLVDLVAAFGSVRPALWHRNLGGTFGPAASLVSSTDRVRPSGIAVGDFDGDGRPDLAFEKQDGDALRCLNRASSAVDGFGPAIGNDLMRGPIVMTSDVDGDLQTETVYVDWKLNAPSRAARVVRRRTRPGGVVEEEVLASWPDLRPFDFVPDRPLVFGDLDADGFADAVALLVDVPAGSELQVLRGTPTGGLGAPATVVLTFEGTGDPVIVRDDMAPLVDVDGDGFLDLALEAIAPPALVLCPGNGAGGFGPCRTIATPTNPDRFDRPEFADLDGDGLLDVHYFRDFDFGSGAWADLVTRRGGPGGTLGPETPFGAGVHYLDTALADVDGDGITDLLALRFFPAMGGEGATELVRFHSPFDPAVPRQVIGPAPFARQVDVLDADADGDLDVVVLGPDGFRLHTNLGGASFSGSPTFLPAGADAGVHLTVGDRDGDGDEDLFWSSSTTGASGVVENVSLGSIGAVECSPAVPNSTGSSGRIRGAGSTELGVGRTRLVVDRLPEGVTTLFLASRTAGATPVMGSVGTLCLGGAIGRFNGAGEIGSTTASGFRVLDVDLDAIPRPNALVAAAPGETWRFSAWHRDTVAGQATSNFTDAVAISFQ